MRFPGFGNLLIILICLLPGWLSAQTEDSEPKKVEILNSDVFEFIKVNDKRIRKLSGNVELMHDSTYMYCDSAFQDVDANIIEAFSHVKIVFSDSMWIESDYLKYSSETQIAYLESNIILHHGKSTIKTDHLTWYRELNYGYYEQGGILEDGENILTSDRGLYYSTDQMAFFQDSVELENPKFDLKTDSLGYDRKNETALFQAPTWIFGEDDSRIYTERGFYDTRLNLAFFYQNPWIRDSTYLMVADTIYFDQELEFGIGRKNLMIAQEDSTLRVYGGYGEFEGMGEKSQVTKDAWAIQEMEDDTLYLFGDTLFIFTDSIEGDSGEGMIAKRSLRAWYGVSFYMNDLQGRNDSLIYHLDDSVISFLKRPVLWSAESQLTGDSIVISLSNNQMDSMTVGPDAFIISKEDTIGFNQIKGRRIRAKFKENQINKMWVDGNAESNYWIKDEKEEYVGLNKAKSTNMLITFKDNKPSKIRFLDQPTGEFFPLHEVLYSNNELEGFEWRIEERPLKPALDSITGMLKDVEISDTLDSLSSDTTISDSLPKPDTDSITGDSVQVIPNKGKKTATGVDDSKTGTDIAKNESKKKVCFLTRWWKKLFPRKEKEALEPVPAPDKSDKKKL